MRRRVVEVVEDLAPPELYRSLVEKLHSAGLETVCYRLEFPLMEVLAEMEYWGIFVRRERLSEISARFASRIEELTQELYALAGETVNLNSPVQLRKVLFETLDEKCCSPEYINEMHERGMILFANAEVYNIKDVISAGKRAVPERIRRSAAGFIHKCTVC